MWRQSAILGALHKLEMNGLIAPFHQALDPKEDKQGLLELTQAKVHLTALEGLDFMFFELAEAKLQKLVSAEQSELEAAVWPAGYAIHERLADGQTPAREAVRFTRFGHVEAFLDRCEHHTGIYANGNKR